MVYSFIHLILNPRVEGSNASPVLTFFGKTLICICHPSVYEYLVIAGVYCIAISKDSISAVIKIIIIIVIIILSILFIYVQPFAGYHTRLQGSLSKWAVLRILGTRTPTCQTSGKQRRSFDTGKNL